MNPMKLVSILEFYRDELEEKEITPKPLIPNNWLAGCYDTHQILQHTAWICKRATKLALKGKTEEAIQLLGLIQGLLFMAGEYTLDELAEHSKES